MQQEVLITTSKKGELLLRVMEEGRPKFISLPRYRQRALAKALVENPATLEAVLDELANQKYSDPWLYAVIRKICSNEADKELALKELSRVGFKPITIVADAVR